ncbi:MAG: AAA family ATPase [Deltaproteobacteria bacterium]|nr:MAG: AAA family ATPase [Deltaproteobacteria bacterium]
MAKQTTWSERWSPAELVVAFGELLQGEAFFVVDGERRILHWSEGATELLGFSADEAIGEHCLVVNRCESCVRGCGIAEHGAVDGASITLYDKGGSPVPVIKHGRAFFDSEGTFLGGIERLRPSPPERVTIRASSSTEVVDFHGFRSQDPRVRELFDIVRHVAHTDGTVLVRGESGSGKELIARAIHLESPRHKGPFVAVNCAALSPGLLESELFGHVRGAFTGAVKDRAGVFTRANGGTLFLDEVAELPPELQAKLLRVLQERAFVPVGGSRTIEVDVRIVAATHRSLRAEVEAGRFREDLMYRLRVIPLYLPPLRDRAGDIHVLLNHFIERAADRIGRRVEAVSPEAMRALLDHSWPGNVRELINVAEYAVIVGRGPDVQIEHLPPEFREKRGTAPGWDPDLDERAQIERALEQSGGHIGDAAELLGMSRPTFWRKRKKYGI